MQDFASIVKQMVQNVSDSGVDVLMCPSPYRGRGAAIEYTDHETAAYYRNWLESGKDLEQYAEHQRAGFPLFDGKSRPPKSDLFERTEFVIGICESPSEQVRLNLVKSKWQPIPMKIIKGRE